MKSYVVELTGIGESHLIEKEVDIDNLLANEAIIKAEYSLISPGTELSRAYGLKKGFNYPVYPGYSLVGRIIKKGEDIDIKEGSKVFVNCNHGSIIRWSNHNSVQEPFILPLKEEIDSLQATTINLLLVALQGVNLAEIKLGYKVGIFGLGPLGILTALLFKKLGLDVIGLDIVSQRCETAKRMGIDNVSDSIKQIDIINDFSNNQGLDIVVDVTGLSNVIETCISVCRSYGQVLLLGSPRQDYEANMTKVFSDIHMKNLKVIGAFNKTIPLHEENGSHDCMMNNYKIITDMIMKNELPLLELISKIMDPKDCKQAYHELMYNKDNTNTIVFDWRDY